MPTQGDFSLDSYDETYLECRGLMHAWRHIGFFNDAGYVSRLLLCQRCSCKKIQTWTRNGQFVESRYDHPENYLLSGQNLNRDDIRRETLRRAGGSVFSSKEALMQSTLEANQRPPTIAEKRARKNRAS